MIQISGKLEEREKGGLLIAGVSIIDIICDLIGKEISITIDETENAT